MGLGVPFWASGRPVRVEVGSRPHEAGWLVWVRDNGIGIEAKYLTRIFGLGERLHAASKDVVTGLVGGDIFADAFLSDDGLTMFYAAAQGSNKPDIFVAWRASTADRFSLPTLLADLNTAADERDPWLSPDGTVFYFTSDRENGVLQIYEATAMRQVR